MRAAVRQPDDWKDPLPVGSEAVPLDFSRPETFAPALSGVSKVFLMRPPQISDVQRFLFPLIDAAQAAGVRQIVFLSLMGAEKNQVVPHRKVEDYLQTAPVSWTILRPGFFMQNLSGTHRADIADRDLIYLPAGRGKTSFIDGDDIAASAAHVLTTPGHDNRAYTLTGSKALDYFEVAGILSEVLGRTITYRPASLLGFARHIHGQGHPWGFVAVMTGIYLTTRLGLAATITDDLPRLLGRPPTPFRTFAQRNAPLWKRSSH
ncbi:MAG: SDR family oxidoreductase [Armatimonadaceae bacterium]